MKVNVIGNINVRGFEFVQPRYGVADSLLGKMQEVYPTQLAEMLSWLAGTERVVLFPLDKNFGKYGSEGQRMAVYSLVHRLYPDGIYAFLEMFPALELESDAA